MMRAVLFDRDGTLVEDVPGIVDPHQFRLLPGVAAAVQRLRARGMHIGVVTNQPRIGNGMLSFDELHAQHAHLEQLVGKIDAWFVCPHRKTDGCSCRKPEPGLIMQAAAYFDVTPDQCVVIGDIGGDIEAARRAGAHAIMVPNAATNAAEIDRAPRVADSISHAVDELCR